jgi:hypothetical protein
MASAIVVACPACQKQIKAPPEIQGKKVRCKGCGQIFPVPGNTPAASAGQPQAAAPKPAAAARPIDEDDEGPQHYGVIKDESPLPRCPHCAKEMESAEAVICLNCGYNTRSRQRVETKKTYETTQGDRVSWLLPGFLCIGGIFVLILLDLFYCLLYPSLVKGSDDWEWTASGGFRVWAVVGSIFVGVALGRFAYQRLVLQPEPPEIVKR